MRLLRVEAQRYGALCDGRLGNLGDGLTVVLGPNEAGKSTYATLVRHVLYGFPTRGGEAAMYRPGDGKRLGRLVFEASDGLRTLERADGPKGGPATLSAPDGEAAEEFLARLTRGVGEDAFRSVFGFSLAELTDAGSLRSVSGRLTATVAGLSVNPQAVADELSTEARELHNPGASRPRVNALVREIKDVRRQLAEADSTTESRRARSRELEDLEASLGPLTEGAAASARRVAVLGTVVARLDAVSRESRALEQQAARDGAARARTAEQLAGLADVSDLIARAPQLEALDEGYGRFERVLERLDKARAEAESAGSHLATSLGVLGAGWGEARLDAVHLDAGSESTLDALADSLSAAEQAQAASAEQAARSASATRDAHARAGVALRAAGVPEDASPADLDAAVARALSGSTPAGGPGTRPLSPLVLPIEIVVAVTGVVLATWGLVSGQPALVGVGIGFTTIAGILGAVLVWRARGEAAAAAPAPAPFGDAPSLDAARQALAEAVRVGSQSSADAEAADRAAGAASDARDVWAAWCTATGLGSAPLAPTAARALLRAVAEASAARAAVAQAARRLEDAARDADDYRTRAIEAHVIADAATSYPDVAVAVKTALARLASARETVRECKSFEDSLELADEKRAGFEAAAVSLATERAALLAQANAAPDASDADLATELELAAAAAEEDRRASDEAREARAALAAELGVGDAAAEYRRLQERSDSLTRQALDATEEYAVLALAGRLVTDALATYRRERQPAVLQQASELLGVMTGGRYREVSTEFGTFEPYVISENGSRKTRSELSTATREQLYLALRIAYIEQDLAQADEALPVFMDDILVNFDEARRDATVRVLAGLAARRQVVFFTCHPATARLFAAAEPSASLLELPPC